MTLYASNGDPPKRSTLRHIVKPGVPTWDLIRSGEFDGRWLLAAVFAIAFASVVIGVGILLTLNPLAGIPAALGAIGIGYGMFAGRPQVAVNGADPCVGKVPITGEALKLLEDADARFAYAERMIGEVPTGLDWEEIEEDVQALMWESAHHAARASALDVEIHDLRYAERGTPQAALRRTLRDRRDEYVDMLKDTQWEAERLARTAGNAAAAAKVAVLNTGSLAALEVAAPSARTILARDSIAAARARLEMLAEVWATLDPANTALAEKVDEDFRQSRPQRQTGR